MLAWVLNTPQLFEDSFQTFYFFEVLYIIRSLKSFTSFNQNKHLIIKHLTYKILFH